MHALHHKGYTLHYNSDFSGEVILSDNINNQFKIEGESLLYFIAQWITIQRITTLEEMDTNQILGID